MKQRSLLKQLTLYQYRYIIGGILLISLLVGLLVGRLDLAPTGLSSAAISSTITSANLNLGDALQSSLIDLPYHLLQQQSIDLFGLHQWSMALPSIVIAVLTGIIFTLMIQKWFRANIALVTGLMLITSAPFLTLGRSAIPVIMLLFWLSLILLAATNILHSTKRSQVWQFVGIVAVGLSLYTPLMVYFIAALVVSGALHPHVRFVFKKINPYNQAVGAFIFLVTITPLLISILTGATDSLHLIGAPSAFPDLQAILANLVYSIKTSLGFHVAIIGDLPKPFFIAPVIVLATLGLVKTIVDNHSARSYMLILWLILLITPLMLDPINLYATLIPVFLLVAIGIEVVIHEWYKLFPLNPYARIGGLIPLSIMLMLVMFSGPYQYFYGHFYGDTNTNYHQALEPTRQTLDRSGQPTALVTSSELQPFYEILINEYPHLEVTDEAIDPSNSAEQVIVHHESTYQPDLELKRIITSEKSNSQEILRVFNL